MSYWIYVTNSDNWAITKKTNILGASARNKNALSKVKKGDKCLVYVKGEVIAGERRPKIVAQYVITSTVFEDSKKMFVAPPNTPGETFPLRFRLEPVRVFEHRIDFNSPISDSSADKRASASIRVVGCPTSHLHTSAFVSNENKKSSMTFTLCLIDLDWCAYDASVLLRETDQRIGNIRFGAFLPDL